MALWPPPPPPKPASLFATGLELFTGYYQFPASRPWPASHTLVADDFVLKRTSGSHTRAGYHRHFDCCLLLRPYPLVSYIRYSWLSSVRYESEQYTSSSQLIINHTAHPSQVYIILLYLPLHLYNYDFQIVNRLIKKRLAAF